MLTEESTTIDPFEGIKRNRLLLERLDADVTVPLEACRPFSGPLVLRGPVRDVSVFRTLTDNRGIWEPHLTEWLTDFLSDGGDFVDAGANLGYFSILAGSLLAGRGNVLALEPLPDHYEYCVENVRLNELTNVQILPYGLWSETTEKEMTSHGDDIHHMGGAHLLGAGVSDSLAQSVRCVSFDNLLASGEANVSDIRLIKMDIEGAEPEALDGMTDTISRMRPVISLELNTYCLAWFDFDVSSVWDRLKALDYRIMILPSDGQAEAFDGVEPPWPATRLREFSHKDQLVRATEFLNRLAPPCFPLDLVAIPSEADLRKI